MITSSVNKDSFHVLNPNSNLNTNPTYIYIYVTYTTYIYVTQQAKYHDSTLTGVGRRQRRTVLFLRPGFQDGDRKKNNIVYKHRSTAT